MQVPLFNIDHDAPGPPCAPYPGSILILGGFRWLGMDGQLRVVGPGDSALVEAQKLTAAEYGEDPQEVVGAALFREDPVNLTSRTLAYWEAAAARGGYVLSELIV